MHKKRIAVLGEGAWGTAIASLLAHNGHDIMLWCYHANVAQEIASSHRNTRFMPGFFLGENIKPTTHLREAITISDLIFEAIPVKFLRSVVEQAKPYTNTFQSWIALSKGIEQDTLMFSTQIIEDVLGSISVASLSGPSFAYDLMRQQMTALSCASTDTMLVHNVIACTNNEYFKVCAASDVIGTQVGGALKNVITLALGMADGFGYSDNTKAMLITMGLNEISIIAQALGGSKETIYSLAGLGDLVLSATGKQSKNFFVGQRLGRGESLQLILQQTGFIPEGINTIQSIKTLCVYNNIVAPLCFGLQDVIEGNKTFQQLLPILFSCLS